MYAAVLMRSLRASKGDVTCAAEILLSKQKTVRSLPLPSQAQAPSAWAQGDITQALKYQSLCTSYPSIDPGLLRDLLEQHGGHLERTQRSIARLFALSPPGPQQSARLVSDNSAYKNSWRPSEEPTYRNPEEPPPRSLEILPLPPSVHVSTTGNAATLQLAHHLSAERAQCFEMAALAFSRGDRVAAKAWSQRARDCDARVRSAQATAAVEACDAVALQARDYAVIDLHGFHVRPALDLLEALLHRLSRQPRPPVLKIITGAGHHSVNGARIKPAVIAYLHSHRLPYCAEGDGAFLVQVPRGWIRL